MSGLQCVGILLVSRAGSNTASSRSHASGIASARAFLWVRQSACATAWRRASRGWLDFLPRTTANASDHHDLLLDQTNSKTRARFVETAFAAFLSQKKYLPARASSDGHCRRELVYVEACGGESEDHGGRHVVSVKEILGHRNIETTMRYSRLSPAHLKKGVNKGSLGGRRASHGEPGPRLGPADLTKGRNHATSGFIGAPGGT